MELQNTSANSQPAPKAAQDARRAVRYSLRANAVFDWLDERGIKRRARGYTRDISVRGAYLIATQCPPRGISVSISVYLPAQPDERSFIRVKAQGRVLRVDPAGRIGAEAGFAIHNDRVLICEK